MDKLFFLFLAYTLIWALIFWYTVRLNQRQKKIAAELTALRDSLPKESAS